MPRKSTPSEKVDDDSQTVERRRQHRWNDQRTLSLVRIVMIYRPSEANHGSVTDSWDTIAKEYSSSIGELESITGRAARDHYKAILKKHRRDMEASARASGVDEDETELTVALDEAVEMEDSLAKASEEADKRKQSQVSFIHYSNCQEYTFIFAIHSATVKEGSRCRRSYPRFGN